MDDIFNINDEQPVPVNGSLLVAKPTVNDDYFRRSVIMLVNHDDKGAMGLVLNNMSTLMLSEVLPDVKVVNDAPLYIGGPVNPEVMFYIHTLGPEVIPDSLPMGDGIYFAGDFEAMKKYLESGGETAGKVKFIAGYSGWSAGQLMDEIDRSDWAVLDVYNSDMMMTGGFIETWQWAVSCFGSRYRLWNNIPLNPLDN